MKHFRTISEYCEGINISAPKHPHFDIRSFEENIKTVHKQMPPFRHEFFAIAIKADGGGKAVSGEFNDFTDGTTIYFKIQFQVLSWDILLNYQLLPMNFTNFKFYFPTGKLFIIFVVKTSE